jgi:hypothetical protein
MPKNPGRVIIASRRPKRQSPKRARTKTAIFREISRNPKKNPKIGAFGAKILILLLLILKFSRWSG